MSALDDVNAAIATLNTVVTELSTPVVETTADTVLAALVSSLQSAGYTVTAPEVETPAEDASEPTEES